MTTLNGCPICGTARPRPGSEPWCCSLACYYSFHGIEPPNPPAPSCHDGVTMTCPVCQRSFEPLGRQLYCGDACRAAAYRRRRDGARQLVTVPRAKPRRPVTVYECDSCGERALGEQRCEGCGSFMRRVGIGGHCPSCEEPVAVAELLGGDEQVVVSH
jgi:predicted amidophosphoribosyltransferase